MRRSLLFSVALLGLIANGIGASELEHQITGSLRKVRNQIGGNSKAEKLDGMKAVIRVRAELDAILVAVTVALHDQDEDVRVEAARLLAELGPGARRDIPDLTQALGDDSPRVRAEAARALGLMAPYGHHLGMTHPYYQEVIPILIEAAKDRDSNVRIQVLAALGSFGPDANAAVPVLREALNEGAVGRDRRSIRLGQTAAGQLACLAPVAREAIPDLINALNTDDMEFRSHVILALGTVGRGDAGAVSTLVRILRDRQYPQTAMIAGVSLGGMGAGGQAALPALIEGLKTADQLDPAVSERFRYMMILSMGRMGPAAKDAVPCLLEVLRNKELDGQSRKEAAYTLGRIGPAAKAALPDLIGFVWTFEDGAINQAVTWALASIGADAVPALLDALKAREPDVRMRALHVLGRMGPRAKDALPQVRQATHDLDKSVAREAALTVKLIQKRKLPQVGSGP
jgi:HEAT repeat protein